MKKVLLLFGFSIVLLGCSYSPSNYSEWMNYQNTAENGYRYQARAVPERSASNTFQGGYWSAHNSQEAANTLKLTSTDCKNFRIIDEIIKEPYGGAHRHPIKQAEILKVKIISLIEELKKIPVKELVQIRKEKYLNITSDI